MAPSHYLNQCWNIVNWTLGDNLRWNLNWNIYIFIQENVFGNVIWKMVAIFSEPQCVKAVIKYNFWWWSVHPTNKVKPISTETQPHFKGSLVDLGSTTLTHWGRVTHKCVGNLTIIGSDNGLLPGRRQAIIRTNAGILLIGPLGTNFSKIRYGGHFVSASMG